jgi:hypothetical protein
MIISAKIRHDVWLSNAGMNGYVSKPDRKEELESILHTYAQVVITNQQHETDDDSSHSPSSIEEHSCTSTLDMERTNDFDLPTVSVTLNDDEYLVYSTFNYNKVYHFERFLGKHVYSSDHE